MSLTASPYCDCAYRRSHLTPCAKAAAISGTARRPVLVEAPFYRQQTGGGEGSAGVFTLAATKRPVNEVRPLLQASSKAIVDIGAIGDATIIKIATNMVTAASVQRGRRKRWRLCIISGAFSIGKICRWPLKQKLQQFRHALI